MKKRVNRKFVGSDALMLESSEMLLELFKKHIDSFMDFDTMLNPAFAIAWAQAINDARGTQTDNTVVGGQINQTHKVKQAMQHAVDATLGIFFFAEKAFEGNAERMASFGKGKGLAHARKSQPRMVEFMNALAKNVARHSARLAAAGATPQIIGAVATTRSELNAINQVQNNNIKNRPIITAERIEALNRAYGFGRTVCKAAKRVFRTKPEIAMAFRFKT